MLRKQRSPEVVRITGARKGLTEDVRSRERRYVISMLVRTVAVLLAVTLWNVQRPLAIVALVLGVVLPYVAVVVANAGRENASSLPTTVLPGSRPMLDATDHTAGAAGTTPHSTDERAERQDKPAGGEPNTRSDRPR
ncbi:DUF3099 domain-containing protein [Streptomyces oceani]|uniref:DUF3099 domain-containing protein n=1 Tax=Streptomyces oceani TaxID=1075402 RepID=UPI00147C3F08|nr:DUF3099 domain-containing protein [Streptomyces oceani]